MKPKVTIKYCARYSSNIDKYKTFNSKKDAEEDIYETIVFKQRVPIAIWKNIVTDHGDIERETCDVLKVHIWLDDFEEHHVKVS